MRVTLLISTISFLLIIGCKSDYIEVDERKFVPGEVSVGIKGGTNIESVFDFINQFDLEIDRINSLTFESSLPSAQLQTILDELNQKEYTNDGEIWFVTGYLHYQTNKITVFPQLFEIHNLAYQNDWLESMAKFKLAQKASGIIRFYVPEGTERKWEMRFENFNIVDWAELNYIGGFEHHSN